MFLIRQNTKVELENGDLISIGDVKIGDRIKGFIGFNKVRGVKHTLNHCSLWEVHENLVGITSDQPIMTTDGWACVAAGTGRVAHPYLKELHQLKQHMSLITDSGEVPCEYLTGLDESEELTCVELEVDGDHTFFVNGHLCHNKGGGGSSGSTTNITKTDPPAYLQPFLTDIATQAQSAYQQVPTGGFSGQLVASPTSAQLTALQQQKDIANSLGGFGAQTQQIAQQQGDKVLSGSYTAPANNQFTQTNIGTEDAVNAYLNPVKKQLQEQIIPTLQGQAIKDGAYGGSRYFNELGTQIDQNYTQKAADIAAQIGYGEQVRLDDQRFQNFTNNQALLPELMKLEQAAALTAPELATSGVNQQLLPSSLLSSAGQAEQLFNQDVLDQAYQQYLLDIAGPFAGLDQYASIVAGVPMGGTSTTTGTAARPSGGSSFLSGALGGGLGAYGLASAIPSLGFLGGQVGIGAGAILGGLLGL